MNLNAGCKRLPRPPAESKLKCTAVSGCTATCKRGYAFPDGTSSTLLVCQDGSWHDENAGPSQPIPDCKGTQLI